MAHIHGDGVRLGNDELFLTYLNFEIGNGFESHAAFE